MEQFNVGDIVEFVYDERLGAGEIVKIINGMFSTKYLIKAKITYVSFFGTPETLDRVIEVKEKYIIRRG